MFKAILIVLAILIGLPLLLLYCAHLYYRRHPQRPIKTTQPIVRFEATRMQVGSKWVIGVHVIAPDGSKIEPAMSMSRALAFCKAKGWHVEL